MSACTAFQRGLEVECAGFSSGDHCAELDEQSPKLKLGPASRSLSSRNFSAQIRSVSARRFAVVVSAFAARSLRKRDAVVESTSESSFT